MPSPIHQYVINLIVSLPIRRGTGVVYDTLILNAFPTRTVINSGGSFPYAPVRNTRNFNYLKDLEQQVAFQPVRERARTRDKMKKAGKIWCLIGDSKKITPFNSQRACLR